MRPFDAEGKFHPVADGHGELRRLAVRGAGAAVSAQGLSLGVQMAATVVLARLLTPSDFGVVAMVTTVSLLIMNFGLNGFTEAVVQAEEISHTLASNLFWINLGTSLLLTLGFAGAGSLLAWFYGDPRVAMVAIGVSLTIFFTGTSVLHLALLKRAMEFPVIAANNVFARGVSVAASITLAWLGWGYWALVAGVVAMPLSTTTGAWLLCRWVPALPRRARGTGKLVRFAINVYGHFTVNYFARNMDNLLVGWRFGAQPLGFYKKAYDLFALSSNQLVSPLAVVAVSALSRLKNDALQYRRYFLRALALLAFVGMGVGADLSLVGNDLIRVVLGPGWEQAGRIFVYFGPGIGVMLLYYTHGWIHLSIGTANRWFRWGIIEFVVTGTLFALGLHWGPVGIAMAWTVSFWLLLLPAFWYAGKPIGFGVGPMMNVVWRYVAAAVAATGVSVWVVWHSHPFGAETGIAGALARMASVSLLFGALYLIAVVALHRSLEPLRQVFRLLPDMLPLRRAPRPASVSAPRMGAQVQVLQYEGMDFEASPLQRVIESRPRIGTQRECIDMNMNNETEHICVCVCTYRRPQFLRRLLAGLEKQVTDGLFTYSVVVVDNDHLRSAEAEVSDFAASTCLPIRYCVEPVQNIPMARNKAVENASGKYLAFIDDDEFPSERWLLTLYEACQRYQVDGVLGPVNPHFDEEPPKWIRLGKFWQRPAYSTGTVIDGTKGRTGNVLLKRDVFTPGEVPFRPELRSGEDQDFFTRMIEAGRVFVWCQEAVAFEVIPPKRWKRSFILRRCLMQGSMRGANQAFGLASFGKSVVAVSAYTVLLPFAAIMGHHRLMALLVKLAHHLGKVLNSLGIRVMNIPYVTD